MVGFAHPTGSARSRRVGGAPRNPPSRGCDNLRPLEIPQTMPGKPLPDAEQLLQALIQKMRSEIGPQTGLIGIHTGGVWLAERLHEALGLHTPRGAIDVSFYRDHTEKRGPYQTT